MSVSDDLKQYPKLPKPYGLALVVAGVVAIGVSQAAGEPAAAAWGAVVLVSGVVLQYVHGVLWEAGYFELVSRLLGETNPPPRIASKDGGR